MNTPARIFKNKFGLVAALVATAGMALGAATTLGGFSASVANKTGTFASGTIQLKEGSGVTTCYSTGTGSGGTVSATNTDQTCGINDFGGAIKQTPGSAPTTTVIKLTNIGNAKASGGTLAVGSCTAAATTTNDGGYQGTDTSGFCAKVDVTVQLSTTATKCLFPKSTTAACGAPTSAGTLATLSSGGTYALPSLTPGQSVTVTVKSKLDTSATNADQGLRATTPMTWSIHQ